MKIYSVRRNQGGFTMLELMGAIIIGAVILVGGMYAFGAGKSDSKSTQETEAMSQLLGRVMKLEGVNGYGAAGTDLTAAAVSRGVVPEGYSVSGNTISNRVGGTVRIVSTGLGVTVTSTNYPASICQDAAQRISGLKGMTTTVGSTGFTTKVDAAQAAAQCSGDATTMAWTLL